LEVTQQFCQLRQIWSWSVNGWVHGLLVLGVTLERLKRILSCQGIRKSPYVSVEVIRTSFLADRFLKLLCDPEGLDCAFVGHGFTS
jgi:hypothetical protein